MSFVGHGIAFHKKSIITHFNKREFGENKVLIINLPEM